MVYFKENYNFTRFRGGGGGWGGVQPIPGAGAGGQNANSRNPLSPLWIRTCDHLKGSGWGGGLVLTIH